MRNQDGGIPLRAEYRGLPAVPVDQVVTGLIPHEPPNFQTPAALELLSEPVCVVTGQRGVGKTQVAAAYARQRVRDGWLVAWAGAETEDQIRAGLVELGDRLGLTRPEDSAEVTAVRVRNHLQTRPGPALLVFDNVVSLDSVRPYLPSAGAAQVVITSTGRGSQVGREIPVDVFSPETALRFLREATGLDDDVAAAELAKEVGYLPLALAQAAARIRAARWDYAKYLENFRKFPAEKHLSRRDGDPYPLGAATAILMAMEPFEGSELVQVLSVLSPDGVSRQVLGDAADDELVRLHEASLAEFAGDSSVLMHRLVQRVIRDRDQEVGAGQAAVVLAADLLFHQVASSGITWIRYGFGRELVQQIEVLWMNTDPAASVKVLEDLLALRLWAANYLLTITDISRAERVAGEVYAECLARLSEDHRLVHQAWRTSVMVTDMQPASILDQLRNDLDRSRETLGSEHLNTLVAATLLGYCYRKLERPDEAIAVLEQALEPLRDQPLDAEGRLEVLDALAGAYTQAGRAADAVAVLERVIGEAHAAQGASSRPALLVLPSLGDAYAALGRLDDMRTACEQAWDMFRKTLGPDHPRTHLEATKLGLALFGCGETEQARALLKITILIATELHGRDHQITLLAGQLLATFGETDR